MDDLDHIKDNFARKLFKRSYIQTVADNQCVYCGKSATEFRDELSRKEYKLLGFCQNCQDVVFGENNRVA